jgi:hypothetical protein
MTYEKAFLWGIYLWAFWALVQFFWKVTGTTEPIPLYTHPAKTLTDDPLVNFKPVWQEKPELTLTDEDAKQAFKEWEKTETFPVSNIEAHGFINGFRWAIAILRKAQEK